MAFAQVILDIPTQVLDSPYTYAVPLELTNGTAPSLVGCAVQVPFANRQCIGFVVALSEEPPSGLDPAKIRQIIKVAAGPYFDEMGAACAIHIAKTYLSPLASSVRLFTPPGGVPKVVRTEAGWELSKPQVGEVDDRWVFPGPAFADFVPRKGAVKQQQVLSALSQGGLRVAELTAEYGSMSSTLKSLEAKQVISVENRRRIRGVEAQATGRYPLRPQLTDGQERALGAIRKAVGCGDGRVVLVDGVTGSGKTEVYLRAIEEVLAQGRTACVLVPEISLTPQTVGRFRGRFGDVVAVLHSRMSQGERFDQWDFIRSGGARVVVGARSALFAPLKDLGLIVIDEEHEGSYKQDSAPRYVARDVAEWMARQRGACLVLGSATPSVESLHACEAKGHWELVSLPERANGRPLPEIQVVDMAKEFSSGHRKMFSRQLSAALEEELASGHKAVLLLNQRGFASFVLCRDCGFVPECPHCSTSLTFHEVGNRLVCHHCGLTAPCPAQCPECASPYLRKFGAGTQRVESELRTLLGEFRAPANGAQLIRMDADTTSGKGAHQRLLDQFAAAERAVLLGTQMIAKGLDFDDVTLVGVINADTMLKLPDFRAGERTFDLIEQVAGRAGRAELDGRVIVQTYCADDVSIRAAASYDRELFLGNELPKRRMLGYPPFVRMTNVLVWGKDEGAVEREARSLERQIAALTDNPEAPAFQLAPAAPCLLRKLRNVFRWHVLVKTGPDVNISALLEPVFRIRKAQEGLSVAVDVDSYDLF